MRGTGRGALVAVLLFLVAAGCASGEDTAAPTPQTGSYGSGVDLDVGPEGPQADDPASQPDTGGEGQPAPDPGAPAPGPNDGSDQSTGGTDPDPAPKRKPPDFGGSGENALFYLRPDHPRLVIEINAVNGREPGGAAVNTLHGRLSSVLDKPSGIQVLAPETFSTGQQTYSLEDVRRIEDAHRTRFSQGDTVAMHYLFLNGRFEEEGVLGVAYRASSIVIFTDQVRAASTPLVPPEAIMRAVMVHEAGHLLRLVNNGYTSPRNHEDPEHPGHTKHRDGVMFWAVESISVANVLGGGPPDDFHPDSRADLEELKTGRLP